MTVLSDGYNKSRIKIIWLLGIFSREDKKEREHNTQNREREQHCNLRLLILQAKLEIK